MGGVVVVVVFIELAIRQSRLCRCNTSMVNCAKSKRHGEEERAESRDERSHSQTVESGWGAFAFSACSPGSNSLAFAAVGGEQ
jgi:hypothetical protein